MTNILYTLTKNGHKYSSYGNNPIDARDNIEIRFGIDLTGATYEEIYKLRVVRRGTVR